MAGLSITFCLLHTKDLPSFTSNRIHSDADDSSMYVLAVYEPAANNSTKPQSQAYEQILTPGHTNHFRQEEEKSIVIQCLQDSVVFRLSDTFSLHSTCLSG